MANDTLADCLTRIRNAQRAGHASVKVNASRVVEGTLSVLQGEGFIESFREAQTEGKVGRVIEVVLKYFAPGEPMIRILDRISTPGRRLYARSEKLKKIASGLGVQIVSTSEGIMSDREARRRKIGGEVMAKVS